MRRSILFALSIMAACAGGPSIQLSSDLSKLPPSQVTVKRVMPKGSLLVIDACDAVRPGNIEGDVVDGLLRESLRQSAYFDIAAGTETCDGPQRLIIAVDPEARVLTAALATDDDAPLPLCAVHYNPTALPAAIDEFSMSILKALGAPHDDHLRPCEVIYSASLTCVHLTERAIALLNRGDINSALPLLRKARSQDPGCTITQAALGTALLFTGQAKNTAEMAGDTLKHMQERLAATTLHRMARLALLAQVVDNPAKATSNDAMLLKLAEASLSERPFDPHGLYSKALALNYQGRFEESATMLRDLHIRWPQVPQVAYHRCFAELATGHAEAALEAIEKAARYLPDDRIVLPMSLALYHANHKAELERYLQRLAKRTVRGDDARQHEVLRIQASLAILSDERKPAARALLSDMEWLRQRPSILRSLAADFAENGEVLVKLGFHRELSIRLQAIDELRIDAPALRQAQAYLAGLVSIHEDGLLPATAIRSLESENQYVWSSLLKANMHHRNGELPQEARYLATAVRITDSALTRAAFARALDALGRSDEASKLRENLKGMLFTIDLRKPMNHPLLNPARALAYISLNP